MDVEFASRPRPVADRILNALKRHGPLVTAEVGEQLGTTAENARQQLLKLMGDGLVEATSEPRGVGRPAQVWRLTAEGNGRFPDAHANVTVDLINAIRTTFGQPALDLLIGAREAETRRTYNEALEGLDDPETRVARLAEIRDREGYMTAWHSSDDDDGWLLIENHCPICAAAMACQGFCRSELDIFREVLGAGLSVEREEHILLGERRCAYRIRRPARDAA